MSRTAEPQCPSSPASTLSKATSPKFVRRKPEYNAYKRMIEEKQKKKQSNEEFVGFFSPRRNLPSSQNLLIPSVELQKPTVADVKASSQNNKNSLNTSGSQSEMRVTSPRISRSRLNSEVFKQEKFRVSNKQNSKQRQSSRESLSSSMNQLLIENSKLLIQNSNLKQQIQNLKQENSLLQLQAQDGHHQLKTLKEQQRENNRLKKSISNTEGDLAQKRQLISELEKTITRLNKKIEELEFSNSFKSLETIESLSNLEEINHQNANTIRKLTQTNKQLQIQLYVYKNKEHEFMMNSVKAKHLEALTIKNKELRAINLKLRQRLEEVNRFSFLEYSPDVTER